MIRNNLFDADTNAFNDYLEAIRMPKNTDEEKAARHQAMQAGLKKAVQVPLKTMKTGNKAWDYMIEIAKFGNIASKSDVEVGARSLETGIWGAYKNVLINLPGIDDDNFKKEITEEAEKLVNRAKVKCAEALKILDERE